MTVQGYRGHLHLGLVTSPSVIPDVWSLLGHYHEAYRELLDAGREELDAPRDDGTRT